MNGNVIVYEWSIPLFDSFPEQRSQVKAGKNIGFDLLVGDADGEERQIMFSGPPEPKKAETRIYFGHLYFLNNYEDLGSINGTVTGEGKGSLQSVCL